MKTLSLSERELEIIVHALVSKRVSSLVVDEELNELTTKITTEWKKTNEAKPTTINI